MNFFMYCCWFCYSTDSFARLPRLVFLCCWLLLLFNATLATCYVNR